jgi:uncharacterized protein (TIGR02996 family)
MMINEELEAAIVRDPDDLTNYAVYGDWLSERGDPRGELIATQLAAEDKSELMRREALRVFAKHRDTFLGKLGSMIAADAFTWRAGFIHRALLTPNALLVEDGARVAASLAHVVEELLAHPSGRFLMDLAVRANDRDSWGRTIGNQRTTVEAIARAPRPRVLRRLQLGDHHYGVQKTGSLDVAMPVLAGVHELVLEGEFALGGKADFPELRTIVLRPTELRRRTVHQLVEASWPKLRALTITFPTAYPEHISREITTLVNRNDMPELTHLALVGYRGAEALLDALARGPMLARLHTLDLSRGDLTDRGLRPLLQKPVAFQHLERFDISATLISRTVFERLKRVLPKAIGNDLTR